MLANRGLNSQQLNQENILESSNWNELTKEVFIPLPYNNRQLHRLRHYVVTNNLNVYDIFRDLSKAILIHLRFAQMKYGRFGLQVALKCTFETPPPNNVSIDITFRLNHALTFQTRIGVDQFDVDRLSQEFDRRIEEFQQRGSGSVLISINHIDLEFVPPHFPEPRLIDEGPDFLL